MVTNIKEIKILDANGNIINPSKEETLQSLVTAQNSGIKIWNKLSFWNEFVYLIGDKNVI